MGAPLSSTRLRHRHAEAPALGFPAQDDPEGVRRAEGEPELVGYPLFLGLDGVQKGPVRRGKAKVHLGRRSRPSGLRGAPHARLAGLLRCHGEAL
jgi:hypothetical protein